ncbi:MULTISPECIES: NAD-dependent epimerase/dehydratase family protein [unclassified Nocardiopsis]|uniref:NAD-dependent epimerase/dehydratase family protein n=1 Tax=Nocardiopsis TaxID=2013 RepID=UPI00387A9C5A
MPARLPALPPLRPAGKGVVLGAGGFLGGAIADALAGAGQDVLGVLRRPGRTLPVRSVVLDVNLAPEALIDLFWEERPDFIVNAAGRVFTEDPAELVGANVALTDRVVDAVARLPWAPRLVHLGSVLEYGPAPGGEPVGEEVPTRPDTDYGQAKAAGTERVLTAARWGAVDAVVLRVANVYGPGTPSTALLGRVADALVRTAGDGPRELKLNRLDSRRDFVDVRDVASAAARAVSVPLDRRRVLNIGRGEVLGVRDLVRDLIELSGVPLRVVEVEHTARTAGSPWFCVDATAAREVLGWSPEHAPRDSLTALWRSALGASGRAHPTTDGLRTHRRPTYSGRAV